MDAKTVKKREDDQKKIEKAAKEMGEKIVETG